MTSNPATRFYLAAIFIFFSFTIKAQLSADFSATPRAGCAPLVVSFHDLSSGNPSQWKWDLGNSTISYLQNPVATYFNPGVYSIKLVVENASGKDSVIKTQYITVHALPTVNFSASHVTGCFPLPVQFTNLSDAGSGTFSSYLWDFGDGNFSSQANPQHTYQNAGNYNVSLRAFNSEGCSKTLTVPNYISIPNGVHAAFSNNTPAGCAAPEAISFHNLSTGTGTLSYSWNFGDGGTSTQVHPVHIFNATGTYPVQLVVVNSFGCRDTIVTPVTISAVYANFIVPSPVCEDAAAVFTNSSSQLPDSVKWKFGDGTTSNLLNPSKTYLTPGNYQVKMIAFFGACKDSVTKNIQVMAKPSALFTAGQVMGCSTPFTVNFNNNSIDAVSWLWNFGDGNTSTEASPAHTYNAEGFFTVSLVSTNASGCSDTLIRPSFVKIKYPVASINQMPQQGCAPFSWTFSSTISSLEPVATYLWDFGDGTTSTLVNPTHVFAVGVYDVQLIITTVGGCTDTIKRISAIRAGLKPVANFSATPRNICAFNPVEFTNLSTGSINEWQWLFGDGGGSSEYQPSHIYQDTGLFTVTLVAGNYGCYDTAVFTNYIHVSPPIARFETALNCDQPFVRTFTDLSIGADQWNWDFGDGSFSTTQSPVHTYTSTGVFNIKLTVKNSVTGCEHSDSSSVTIADEQANFSATATVLCKRTSTTFNAVMNHPGGIVQYEWNFGEGSVTTGNPVSHVYPLAGSYNVQLIITDAAGCRDTLTRANYIRVNGPAANFSSAVPGSCLLSSVSFNDLTITDGVNAITEWKWQYGDGVTEILTAPPFSHAYASQGVYAVSLRVTDATGCADSITKPNLLVISVPVAAFTSVDTASCPGASVRFTNQSAGPGLVYNWDFGDGSSSAVAAPVHIYSSDGNYTIRLRITDRYGCVSELVKPNYIKIATPVAAFLMNDSVSTCPPLIVQFTNTSQNHTSYNWDFGDGNFSSEISPSHFYNSAGTYFPKLIITGPGGCTSVKTRRVEIRGPKGSFSYQNFVGCNPLTVNFTATTQSRTSFVWDFNDGTTIVSNDSVISHTYTTPGIYVPKMILKDAAGCVVPITGEDTVVVSGVTAAFNADTLLLCSSGSVRFTNATLSNDIITGYLWHFGDGSTSTAASPTHHYSSEGFFSVKLNAFTAMGCIDSVTSPVPVKIVKTPSISFTASANGCVPLPVNFNGNLLNADTSAINWSWSFSDGRTANGKNINGFVFPTAGNYTATLVAENSSGCKDTASNFIEAYALPVVNAGIDIGICEGTGRSLNATGAVSYSWSPATGLSCSNCASPVAKPAIRTEYIVTGTSSHGCKANDSVMVAVSYPFKMQYSRGDTLCVGESATLSASGAAFYNWTPSAGLSSSNDATVKASPVNTTNYMLVGSDTAGCFKDTAYFPVKVYPIPVVSAGEDITMNVGQVRTLIPVISPDVTTVHWSPTGSIFRSVFPNADIKPKETTTYKVVVSNEGGCRSSDDITVNVLCNGANVFIPNTFSPNADGTNDLFYARGTGLFIIKTARVFNRWGELVFEASNIKANDAKNAWDGTYKGQKLASDVFIYMFEIVCDNNAVLVYKGDIALIR